jgi:C_GCAxxG_C_C family probable redox protein
MSQIADQAATVFNQGFNCAQAVLKSCGETQGLPAETALRVAGVFGGGIARTGQTCGAVTGALMALGLRHAMVTPGDTATRQRSYDVGREFMRRFAAKHGSITCRDLLGCDLSTPEGMARMREEDLHHKVCEGLVRDAADLVQEIHAAPPAV